MWQILLKMLLTKMTVNTMIALILFGFLVSCGGQESSNDTKTDDLAIAFTLKSRWKHDTDAWTQGLVIHKIGRAHV